MTTVHAVYENGVFRPTQPVSLPDACEVEFEPRPVRLPDPTPEALAAVYATLSLRFESGVADTAERHDEHQP